ncbi:hypothetical protein A9975_28555 [Cupriavidus sp. UME77]|nr:hypothetical protein [Cupriavidus sp. UME77]
MGDCQLVLRFFALDNDEHIHGSMKSMLDRCMERNLDITRDEANALGERYVLRLALVDQLFDGVPFRLNQKSGDSRPIAGVYDGVMIAVDQFWRKRTKLLANKQAIQNDYAALTRKLAKTGTLTGAANTAADIKERIALFRDLFKAYV